MVLTRSHAQATNQPVFVDEQWNDAYIQTKDEQIDAMQAQGLMKGWYDSDDEPGEEEEDENEQPQEKGDSEEVVEELREQTTKHSGFLTSLFWTVMNVLLAPTLLYGWLLRPKGGLWPFRSSSLYTSLLKAYLNAFVIAWTALVTLWSVCSCDWRRWQWYYLPLLDFGECQRELVDGWHTCLHAANITEISTCCTSSLWKECIVAIGLVVLARFDRFTTKALVVLSAFSYVAMNAYHHMRTEEKLSVQIVSIDPPFAFVNESIFIAIDGQNLENGAQIAWVPYWGGSEKQHPAKCEKLFEQALSQGGVRVRFDTPNDYTPCYRIGSSSFSSTSSSSSGLDGFECFEHIKLRVKHPKSRPGWSLDAKREPSARDRNEL